MFVAKPEHVHTPEGTKECHVANTTNMPVLLGFYLPPPIKNTWTVKWSTGFIWVFKCAKQTTQERSFWFWNLQTVSGWAQKFPSVPATKHTPHPSSPNEEAAVPVAHSALLPFVSAGCWGGGGVIAEPAQVKADLLSGDTKPSLCVCPRHRKVKRTCRLRMFVHAQTHTHLPTNAHTQSPLHSSSALNNHCSYLGKVIICSPVCLLALRALSCQVWEETETEKSLCLTLNSILDTLIFWGALNVSWIVKRFCIMQPLHTLCRQHTRCSAGCTCAHVVRCSLSNGTWCKMYCQLTEVQFGLFKHDPLAGQLRGQSPEPRLILHWCEWQRREFGQLKKRDCSHHFVFIDWFSHNLHWSGSRDGCISRSTTLQAEMPQLLDGLAYQFLKNTFFNAIFIKPN